MKDSLRTLRVELEKGQKTYRASGAPGDSEKIVARLAEIKKLDDEFTRGVEAAPWALKKVVPEAVTFVRDGISSFCWYVNEMVAEEIGKYNQEERRKYAARAQEMALKQEATEKKFAEQLLQAKKASMLMQGKIDEMALKNKKLIEDTQK